MFLSVNFSASLAKKVKETVSIISKAIDRYGKHLALCFNGGKDATVLLDLVLRVCEYKLQSSSKDILTEIERQECKLQIKTYYLDNSDDFEEITSFLHRSQDYWNIKLIKLPTSSLKDGLSDLIENYDTKAIFLGVRNSDLKSPLTNEFQPTTEGWPDAMRVMPILKWNYHEIWEYIEKMNIPYCSLYDQGYTSIGSKNDTFPNPNLYDKETDSYKNAKFLEKEEDERKGRINKI